MTNYVIHQKNILARLLGDSNRTTEIKRILITPIPSVYNRLRDIKNLIDENLNCFYPNFIYKNTLIINIPQGIQAQDIIQVLPSIPILFFGFAASLSKQIKAGDLVQVYKVVCNEEGKQYYLKEISQLNNCVCGYSPCLLGELADSYQKKAIRNKCDIIDMECVYCSVAAYKNQIEFSAWMLITDQPGQYEFWENDNRIEAIKENNFSIIMSELVKYCFIDIDE